MRILLTGGGTAGHINPAIAIAEIVKANCPHAAIAFVGTPEGMENRLVEQAGYPMYHVRVRGLARSLSPRNIEALWLALRSPQKAKKILDDFQPDAVIGTGGYVSWPILAAAATRGIPTALHESNAAPGLTTKRLAPRMTEIWLNFKETANALPKTKAALYHTGNPLRNGFHTLTRQEARKRLGLEKGRLLLLSFGGSLGAPLLNEACLRAGTELCREIPQIRHVHACGRAHYEELEQRYPHADGSKNLLLLPYIEDMPLYMAAADIVIARAGAMTLSELALCGSTAILVPSPYVTDDHQYKNAVLLEKAGAATLIEEKTLSAKVLIAKIKELAEDKEKREACGRAIQAFATPFSNRLLWKNIQKLAKDGEAKKTGSKKC